MANENVSTLNSLIETARDGENGFRQAAEHAKDPELKRIFERYAQQRASYVTQLQSLVSELGEKPAESGHIAASLHRGWIAIKDAVSGGDKAIVDEAESGEDAAIKAYREALSSGNLPSRALQVVQQQFAGVQEAHGVVRNLKHNWKGSASATASY